jgi:hypothetical protein
METALAVAYAVKNANLSPQYVLFFTIYTARDGAPLLPH